MDAMDELRAHNIMISSLEAIINELKGIDDEDLTKAEIRIRKIAAEAIKARNALILGDSW